MENIIEWMGSMRLKINPTKTELMYFGSKKQLTKSKQNSIKVESNIINRSSSMKLLGAILDENLSFEKHINNQCRKAMMNFHRIKNIRPFIDQEACQVLVHGLIIAHLDYANCLLYGLPKKSLWKLQRIQNMAARLILNIKDKNTSVTKARQALHWLPIEKRIEFKLLVIVFKCLSNQSPPYLQKLIRKKETSRYSRSSKSIVLEIPYVGKRNHAWRAFSVSGPRLWNKLPSNIRNITTIEKFRKELKTHLFRQCYNV